MNVNDVVCFGAEPIALLDYIAVEHVEKTYRAGLFHRSGVVAVRDVSLTIPVGSVFGLLGPNRAGKTTLVKLLLSLSRPSAGSVSPFGEPAANRETLARVGYMHENHAFPRYLTAAALLRYYGAMGLERAGVVAPRVAAVLDRVGLADRSAEPIRCLSKGMVQRLGLAQALVNDPELLVLDEPTEGLDLDGRALLRKVMEEFRRRGRSVLVASHALTEVEQVCDRAAVLFQGRLVYLGPLAELMRRSARAAASALCVAITGCSSRHSHRRASSGSTARRESR